MSLLSYNSFLAGNKEEIAIFMEDKGKEAIFNMKNPQITDVTIEEKHPGGISTHRITGKENPQPQRKHVTATITIETIEWEHIWGENLEDELPDTVKNMNVEELLHAVNKKLDEGEQ